MHYLLWTALSLILLGGIFPVIAMAITMTINSPSVLTKSVLALKANSWRRFGSGLTLLGILLTLCFSSWVLIDGTWFGLQVSSISQAGLNPANAVEVFSSTTSKIFESKWISPLDLPIIFHCDKLSALMIGIIAFISLMAVIYGHGYFNIKERTKSNFKVGITAHYQNRVFRNLLSSLGMSSLIVSMLLVVMASDMLSFLLSWELMSVSSLALISYYYERKSTRRSVLYYFIFTYGGTFFILMAFAITFAYTGQTTFAAFASLGQLKLPVYLLLLVGFGSKAGIFPFHVWLPYAHPVAPSQVSAILSGVMIKVAVYGLIRIYFCMSTPLPALGWIVMALGIITVVFGALYSPAQKNLKRLLAYCSVENIGRILVGMGLGMLGVSSGRTELIIWGWSAAILHLINHALFKSLLFLGAGSVAHANHHQLNIDELGGLLKTMRITGTLFMLGALAISGMPLFNGFISELFLYMGAFKGLSENALPLIFMVLVILGLALSSALSVVAFTKVIGLAFLGEARDPKESSGEGSQAKGVRTSNREVGVLMWFPMAVIAAVCLLIGIFPVPILWLVLKVLSSIPMLVVSSESFWKVSGQILNISYNFSLVAGIFILILVLLYIFIHFIYRIHGQRIIKGPPTWDCGFSVRNSVGISPAIGASPVTGSSPVTGHSHSPIFFQYSGTSYVWSVLQFFRPLIYLKEHYHQLKNIFPPHNQAYRLSVYDFLEKLVLKKVMIFFWWPLYKLHHSLGQSKLQLHIFFIFLTLAITTLSFMMFKS